MFGNYIVPSHVPLARLACITSSGVARSFGTQGRNLPGLSLPPSKARGPPQEFLKKVSPFGSRPLALSIHRTKEDLWRLQQCTGTPFSARCPGQYSWWLSGTFGPNLKRITNITSFTLTPFPSTVLLLFLYEWTASRIGY